MQANQSDNCVPFFPSDKHQIVFEFGYLVILLILVLCSTAAVRYYSLQNILDRSTSTTIYAALGGLFGGWTFDAKWFYRVTARGKDDQYTQHWQKHKFYWRVLIPFVAGAIAFAFYLLVSSGALPIVFRESMSGRMAFGLTFFLGYFSDLVLSRLAKWTEQAISPQGL